MNYYEHHIAGRWATYDLMNGLGIPRFPGAYAIYFGDELVYVGQSNDIGTRFYEHKFRYGYCKNIITPWGDIPESVKVTLKVKRTRVVGDWAMWEIRLIRRLCPRFNQHHRRLKTAA